MAAATTAISVPHRTSIYSQNTPHRPTTTTTTTTTSTTTLSFPLHPKSLPKIPLLSSYPKPKTPLIAAAAADSSSSIAVTSFHGACYVVGDNIDTDQIIPAEHLTLVPSNPDEYRKLGSLALIGLPSASYPVPFVDPSAGATRFPIIVAGANFGCGSSREHAPVALGAAGARAVVAESYARIFFRNSVATGEVYPVESDGIRVSRECSTGDIVTVDLGASRLVNHTTGKEYGLKPIGDAGPVIEAGGIFAYARKTGMIPS